MKIVRIKQKTKQTHWKIILLSLISLAIIALAYAYYKKIWPFTTLKTQTQSTQTINYGPPTSDETTAGEQVKNPDDSSTAQKNDTSPNTTTPTTNSTVVVIISAASVDSGVLKIRSLIQSISSGGSCTLLMTGPSNKSYSASAGVQAGPTSSTCAGFDVPVNLLSSGDWKITINFVDNALTGSTSREVTIP